LNSVITKIGCSLSVYAVPYPCIQSGRYLDSFDQEFISDFCKNKYFYRSFIFLFTRMKNPEMEIERSEEILISITQNIFRIRPVDKGEAEDIIKLIGE
ncbi:MAG: hypothetical protein ACP5UV_07455, partial [Thermoplasmata archaeon]